LSVIIQPGSHPYLAYISFTLVVLTVYYYKYLTVSSTVYQLTASYYYVSNWFSLSKQVHRPNSRL